MLRLVPTRQRMLRQWQQASQYSRMSVIPHYQAHSNTVKSSAVIALSSRASALDISQINRTWHQAANKNVLSYWKSAALAVGACGTLVLLDEQKPAACASSKRGEEDPLEQAKKMFQNLSTNAIARLASLLPEDYSNLQKKVDDFLASGKGGQISWGFGIGACAGFALKKLSKVGAATIGTLFILLQCASYSGYVDVDYKKLEWDLKGYLDIDQDGKFDTKDLESMYKLVMKVLEFSLPAGSGFTMGFVLGFRLG